MVAAAPANSRWLQGPVSDVLLGTGMLYLPFFVISLFVGPQLVIGSFSLVPFLIVLFAYSHLGATLVRIYARPEDRAAYRLFSLWVTLAIAAIFLVGLWVPIVGSVMLTLYLTVVPWHFTGQNYGIALVFLRRRGVEITPGLKRYLYASFILSYALWILALHAAQPGTLDYAPLRLQGTIYAFLPLGIPAAVLPYLLAGVGILYVGALIEVATRLLSRTAARTLVPTALVVLSQGLWFSAPVIGRVFFEPQQLGPLAGLWAPWNAGSTFLVVSLMHSLQYLWITDYYVRKETPGTTTRAFLWKSLLAGMAILGIPLLLLLPEVGGGPSFEAGLFLMLGGALNVHHVMMDGVIWKLRNTKIASILIGGGGGTPAAAAGPQRSWPLRLVFVSGLVGLVLAVGGELETQLRLNPAMAEGRVEQLEASLDRLFWMGRDNSVGRARLGFLKAERGDLEGAMRAYERSVELVSQKPDVWVKLGIVRERAGELKGALEAYDRALALQPDHVNALVNAGRVALRTGQTVRARQLLARASELDPDKSDVRLVLDAIDRASARR